MTKRTKIILGLIGLGLFALIFFVAMGFYTMDIEDHYGDNQNFFYGSKFGDIAVNRDKKEFKKIEKSWTRVFIVDEKSKVDIWTWVTDDSVAIYRARPFVYDKEPTYKDIERLIAEDKLELIIKNW
jgi:hypothetical protein